MLKFWNFDAHATFDKFTSLKMEDDPHGEWF